MDQKLCRFFLISDLLVLVTEFRLTSGLFVLFL